MTKAKYKIKNWSSYNKSLVERGSINLWINDEVLDGWFYRKKGDKNKAGHPFTYSDTAIEMCLTVRAIYKIPLRMTEGFLQSLFGKLPGSGIEQNLHCPDYSTISKRGKTLSVKLKRYQNLGNITDIVVDSTGLKVFGEGEWKVRQHKAGKRRTWRKFHIAADPLSQEILATELTGNNISDDHIFGNLTDQIPEAIGRAFGDGAYDRIACYEICHNKNITPIIPPQRKAILQDELQHPGKRTDSKKARDNNIERIRELEEIIKNSDRASKEGMTEETVKAEARKEWKIESDYHTRSIAETAMFRLKQIFGDRLLAHNLENQKTEMLIKTNILNKFTSLGMPESWPVYS